MEPLDNEFSHLGTRPKVSACSRCAGTVGSLQKRGVGPGKDESDDNRLLERVLPIDLV